MDWLKSNGHILSICKIHPSRIACSWFFPYSGGHNEAFSPGRYPVSSNFFYLFFLPRYCKYFHIRSYITYCKKKSNQRYMGWVVSILLTNIWKIRHYNTWLHFDRDITLKRGMGFHMVDNFFLLNSNYIVL